MPRTVETRGAVQVTVDTRGIDYIKRVLVRGSPRMRVALEDGCYVIMGFWRNRYRSGAGWPGLSEETKKLKARAGYNPSQILRATDQLYRVVDPNSPGKNVPGRRLYISAKRLRANVGYGGGAKYKQGDPNYAKSFTYNGGTIVTLAEIHRRGAYRRGKARVIIVPPDRSTVKKVERVLRRGFDDEIGRANGMS